MDTTKLKMGKPGGARRVAESFRKLLNQKPSQELLDALKRIKDKEDAAKNKKVAIERDAEI